VYDDDGILNPDKIAELSSRYLYTSGQKFPKIVQFGSTALSTNFDIEVEYHF
jgi:hypothetical protein